MTLANCKHCGILFLRGKSDYCSECQTSHDRMYMKLRDYVRSHPQSTVMDAHAKTGIPVAKLLELGSEEFTPFSR